MKNAFSLKGRAALVTGSSQGIGLAIGSALMDAGARVVLHGLQRRAKDIPKGADYISRDLLSDDGPEKLMAATFKLHPKLDTLVCNAGSFFDVAPLEMTRERWERTFQLNVTATFFVVQAFARRLAKERRGGSILITSSTNGFFAEADSCAYDASKGALVMLTKSLAVSLAEHSIRVNGIAPGLIKTPLTSVWMEQRASDLLEHYKKKILLRRVGTAVDVAGAAVYLTSNAASYITGEIIVIDGGLTTGQIGRM